MSEHELNLAKLHARLRDLHSEIAEVHNEYLKTLAPPTQVAPATPPTPQPQPEETFPLKSSTGDKLLGTMFLSKDQIRLVPATDLKLKVSTPPLQAFLINRVLESMRKKDVEVGVKRLPLSYEVLADGDIFKELVIRDYGEEARIKEIKASCRWSLEKMSEKIPR